MDAVDPSDAGLTVQRIEQSACSQWRVTDARIEHASGRYFSIECVRVHGVEHVVINQPEIGMLAFLFTADQAGRQWLVQNKPEPGNVGFYQGAPSVQATKSNYERVHGGAPTRFLADVSGEGAHSSVLNSEQGDRFFNKFNRNVKMAVPAAFDLAEDTRHYRWVDTAQLKQRLLESYALNTDARSVLVSGRWDLLCEQPQPAFTHSALPETLRMALARSYQQRSVAAIVRARALLREAFESSRGHVDHLPFDAMTGHLLTSRGIQSSNGKEQVGYFDVCMPGREVERWQQPLLLPQRLEQCALLFRVRHGVAEFKLRIYAEPGFIDRVEFGPTLQTGIGVDKLDPPHVAQTLSQAEVLATILQSDEGGRFYQNIARYTLALVDDDTTAEREIWLSAGEIEMLCVAGGLVTNELRTLLSLLLHFA